MTDTPHETPVLLVCGAAEDDELWVDVRQRIPHARSVILPNDEHLRRLRESVTGALKEASGPSKTPCVIAGHSLGGAVATLAASHSPELVGRLVVVAAGSSMPVHPSLWRLLEAEGEKTVIKRFAAATAPADAADATAARANLGDRMRAMMERAPAGTLTNHLKACDSFAAPELEVPAVVLIGADDRLVSPALAAELAQRLHGSYELIADAGHQLPWESPERVISALHGHMN